MPSEIKQQGLHVQAKVPNQAPPDLLSDKPGKPLPRNCFINSIVASLLAVIGCEIAGEVAGQIKWFSSAEALHKKIFWILLQ